MTDTNTTFLTSRELAAEFGYCTASVLAYVRAGVLKPDHSSVGGAHLFARTRLAELRDALFVEKRARSEARMDAKRAAHLAKHA